MLRLSQLVLASFTVLVLAAAAGRGRAEIVWPAATSPVQINVTTDSQPGWLPSSRQVADMRAKADQYFAAKDSGASSDAYKMLAEQQTEGLSFESYAKDISASNQRSGPLKERRVVDVAWTKDPPQAPAPGVYAAIDTTTKFANIDRQCGYLILYQRPSGGEFQIMREEENILDNATANMIEKQHSRADVDLAWSKLSANCPGQPHIEPPPLAEQADATIGYSTVAAALKGLHASPAVVFSSKAGWTVAEDKATMTVWSFAPLSDPAYPAVAKRQVVANGKGSDIVSNFLCESSKSACDNFVRRFAGN